VEHNTCSKNNLPIETTGGKDDSLGRFSRVSPSRVALGRAPSVGRRVVTSWDVREAARAASFGGLALVLAWLVTAATDEGGVAWAERAARTLPLAPACAALGTWLGEARGWARGEGRALAALGRSPLASSAAAVLGGAAVAVAAAAAMVVWSQVDVSGFFPVAHAPDTYVSQGGGVFLDTASGYRVEPDGSITPPAVEAPATGRPGSPRLPPYGRAAAALSTGLAGLAFPLLASRASRGSWWARSGLAVAALAASTLLFHAAAAHLVGATVAVVPSCVLLWLAAARTMRS